MCQQKRSTELIGEDKDQKPSDIEEVRDGQSGSQQILSAKTATTKPIVDRFDELFEKQDKS
jgi:hypothetical protein